MSKKEYKMNKSVLVSFLLIASVLFLATTASAAVPITDNGFIEVNDVEVGTFGGGWDGNYVSVDAGETIEVKVEFTVMDSLDIGNGESSVSGVTVKAELGDVTAVTSPFTIEQGVTVASKVLTLKVPNELKDDLSEDMTLTLTVESKNHEYKTEITGIILRVQRPSYDINIKSITTSNTVEAGSYSQWILFWRILVTMT